MFKKDTFQKREDGVSLSARSTYAMPRDFCRIFEEDKTALYLLSLVLTADPEKAEQCFVAGLEDSIHGNPVFKEWARSWSKRMIIKNAIRMITPAAGQMNGTRHVSHQHVSHQKISTFGVGRLLTAVVDLSPFERFAFVMSALEGYSLQECSILLSCTRQEVTDAQTHALRHLALTDSTRATPIETVREGIRTAQFLELMRAS